LSAGGGIWDQADPANVPLGNFAGLLTAAQPGSDVALYWNVHTTVFQAGEIRGQLVAARADKAEGLGEALRDVVEGLRDIAAGSTKEGLLDIHRGLTTALQFDLGVFTESVRDLQGGVHDLIRGDPAGTGEIREGLHELLAASLLTLSHGAPHDLHGDLGNLLHDGAAASGQHDWL